MTHWNDPREQQIEYQYPKRTYPHPCSNKHHWTYFQCSRCKKERTVERTGYIIVAYGKPACYKCCSRDELEKALFRISGGKEEQEWKK